MAFAHVRRVCYSCGSIISVTESCLPTVIDGARRSIVVAEFDNNIITTFDSVDEGREPPFICVGARGAASYGRIYYRDGQVLSKVLAPS